MNAPTSIAHYRITAMLGQGGMGAVYRATDTRLNREVAIKVLPDAFANDSERLARFTREAQILAGLNHPNIATIFGVEEHTIVMELVQGLPPVGPFDPDQTHTLINQLIDALEYAHDKGIVHRDLKPANLILSTDGRLKVLDFGLAKALSVDASRPTDASNSPTLTIQSTTVGMVMGTAAYMAPEQAKGHSVDKRADIWSFGVVVYELLSGKRLFEGDSVSDILAAVLRQDIDTSLVPARYQKLLKMCLTRDPNKRLRDISGARLLLEDTPPPSPTRRGLPVWAAVVPALGVALLAAGWIYTRPKPIPVPVEFEIDSFNYRGAVGIAISGDGTRLAFASMDEKRGSSLMVRSLDAAKERIVPGTESNASFVPFFGPDDRSIYFIADRKFVKRVNVETGTVQPIYTGATFEPLSLPSVGPTGTLLLREGARSLTYLRGGSPAPTKVPLTIQAESTLRFPALLPDEHHLLVVHRNGRKESLWLTTLTGEKPRVLLDDVTQAIYSGGYLIFHRQDQLFAQPFQLDSFQLKGEPIPIATADAGQWSVNGPTLATRPTAATVSSLTWYTLDGKSTDTGLSPETYGHISLSPDETRIAYTTKQGGDDNIWIQDITRGAKSKLTFQTSDRNPMWSPDGKSIAYGSTKPGGGFKLCMRPADGTGTEDVLLESKQQIFPAGWSPDGRWVLILEGAAGNWNHYLVSTGSDHKKVPFLVDSFDKTHATFSPDGRWIVYNSNETGRSEVYVRPAPPEAGGKPGLSGKWQISTDGGSAPRWADNGASIVFTTLSSTLHRVRVTPTANGIQISAPTPLFDIISRGGPAETFAVGQRSQRILAMKNSGSAPPVIVLYNWQQRLRVNATNPQPE